MGGQPPVLISNKYIIEHLYHIGDTLNNLRQGWERWRVEEGEIDIIHETIIVRIRSWWEDQIFRKVVVNVVEGFNWSYHEDWSILKKETQLWSILMIQLMAEKDH